jgi:hypothetical protein
MTVTTFNITFEINEIRLHMHVFSNTTMVERPWLKQLLYNRRQMLCQAGNHNAVSG